MSRVEIGPDGCWNWTHKLHSNGYGIACVNGRHVRAHRLSWEIHRRPIPAGGLVCHHCDNRRCVNPGHLYIGDHRANANDMFSRGRAVRPPEMVRGERNGMAKFTEADAREIIRRLAAGETQRPIAREFGVDQTTISLLWRGKHWAHLRHPEPQR